MENITHIEMIKAIIYSTITNSVILGIFIFILHSSIKSLLNNRENSFKTILNVNEKRHAVATDAFSEIWKSLIEIDRKIRHDMPNKIQQAIDSGSSNGPSFDEEKKFLMDCKYAIENKSIFLTEKLHNSVLNHLEDIMLPAYNGYLNILQEAINKQATIDDVNSFYESQYGEKYRVSIKELRKLFHQELREILVNT